MCERHCLLQPYFHPDLPDVRATLFAWKKAIAEQIFGAPEISRFGTIQSQLVDQARWHVGEVRIALECLNPLARWAFQNTKCLIQAGIELGIFWIDSHSSAKSGSGSRRILFDAQKRQ